MNCIVCGCEAGYNRVVVATVRDAELGRFCMNCERREFGRRLELQETRNPARCSFCDEDSFVALPRLEPAPVYEGNRVVNRVTYERRETTPHFCRDHYRYLRDAGPGTPGPPADGGR